jgi:phosphatidylinositol glycan class B
LESAVPAPAEVSIDRTRVNWPAIVALAALPVVIAVVQLGRIHPDEVYQFLEPAYLRTRGYGVAAWEWHVGLRNWALPMLLGGLLRISDALGIENPRIYRALLALPQWLLHALALASVFRYARRQVRGRAAWVATGLVALAGPVLIFAGRTLGESYSADALLIALELLDRDEPWPAAWGGVWLGLSVVARYGSAVFVLAALGWLAAQRRFRALLACVAGGLLIALLLGALDRATWGDAFHSLLAYARFNVLSGEAAQRFGSQPWFFYALPLVSAAPLWVWAGLVRERRLSLPLVCAAVYVVAVSLTAHKEERFLYPAVVLFCLAGVPAIAGWALAREGALRNVALAGLLATTLAPLAFGPELRGDQLRAIVQATRGDAHGLLIVNEGLWGAGGFFYIGKRIPWLTCDWPQDAAFQHAMRDRRFDRAVSFEGRALDALEASGFKRVGQIGRETLLERP